MAKHPVPKKKTSKARTNRRYKAFQNKARIRLDNAIQIVKCTNCGEPTQQHRACPACDFYRGKSTLKASEVEAAKVTTIKAE